MNDHATRLETLAKANSQAIKTQAEAILPALGAIEVIKNRTGLMMLPMRDSVTKTDFHLGEVLVAEAHIRLTDHQAEGYGMVIGRDLEQAMAMAVIDAAYDAKLEQETLDLFVEQATQLQQQQDDATLRQIEATRVQMETF